MKLENVIDAIRRGQQSLLAPDADRRQWDHEIAAKFEGYSAWNLTDFNYGKSHTYVIPAHRGTFGVPTSAAAARSLIAQLGGDQYSIILKLSVIAPFYLADLLHGRVDETGSIVEQLSLPASTEHAQLLQSAHEFAQERGMKQLPIEYLDELVPDVELELAAPGTVTVYNCLFEDQDNFMPSMFGAAGRKLAK